MRFAILFAIVLLAIFQTALGKITKQTIEFDGKKRVYYLYVPEQTVLRLLCRRHLLIEEFLRKS